MSITDKEIQMVKLRARGMKLNEIAEKLGISESTVSKTLKQFEIKKADLIVTLKRLVEEDLLDERDKELIINFLYPDYYRKLRFRSDDVYSYLPKLIDEYLRITEEEFRKSLSKRLNMVEDGLKVIETGKMIESGKIDILAEDRQGKQVIIEVRDRRIDSDDVAEIYHLVDEYRKIKPDTRVIVVCSGIDEKAEVLMKGLGLDYRIFILEEIEKIKRMDQ